MRIAIDVAVSAVVLSAPRIAAACAVCFAGQNDETRGAFLATTGLLSALPLVMIGSLIWWLHRRSRQIRDERDGSSVRLRGIHSGVLPPKESVENRLSSGSIDHVGKRIDQCERLAAQLGPSAPVPDRTQ